MPNKNLLLPSDMLEFFKSNPQIIPEDFCLSAIREKISTFSPKNIKSISNNVIKIFTDGACRGNPGISGAGWVLKQDNKILYVGRKYLGIMTNNQAEYHALILALTSLKNFAYTKVEIYMDSELIVKQIKGEYKVKDSELKLLFLQVKNLLPNNYFIQHIKRELNTVSDKLSNEAIDQQIK